MNSHSRSGVALVSIVIPAYNAARYLREAIDSVLGQTYRTLELIVVDDGSIDETALIAASYGTSIHLVRQANAGQSAALNRGWELSKGELLGYLSADDRLHADAVGILVAALQRDPAVVLAYPDFGLIDPASREIRSVSAPGYDQKRLIADGVCLVGPGALFRRSAFRAAGGWATDLAQVPDYDFLLRLSLVGPFVRLPQPLADFRVHPESATYRASSIARADEPVCVMQAFYARPDLPAAVRSWRRRAMANALVLAAYRHARSRRRAGPHGGSFRLCSRCRWWPARAGRSPWPSSCFGIWVDRGVCSMTASCCRTGGIGASGCHRRTDPIIGHGHCPHSHRPIPRDHI